MGRADSFVMCIGRRSRRCQLRKWIRLCRIGRYRTPRIRGKTRLNFAACSWLRVTLTVTKAHSDQFEMRRLESLSNTIFGVAMTLLAYGLPQAAQFGAAPTWGELANLYAARLIAL